MSYKFKYHPDGWIGINSGASIISFDDFKEQHSNFPIVKDSFFEYYENGDFAIIVNISNTWTGIKQHDLTAFQNLIAAINNII